MCLCLCVCTYIHTTLYIHYIQAHRRVVFGRGYAVVCYNMPGKRKRKWKRKQKSKWTKKSYPWKGDGRQRGWGRLKQKDKERVILAEKSIDLDVIVHIKHGCVPDIFTIIQILPHPKQTKANQSKPKQTKAKQGKPHRKNWNFE